MNNQDWERFGEDIRRTIQDAVEYGNYDRLNQTIANTVNQATEWVNKNVGNKGRSYQQGSFGQGPAGFGQPNYQRGNYRPHDYRQSGYRPTVYNKQMPAWFKVNTSSKVAGILFTVFGCAFGVPLFIWFLILMVAVLVSADFSAGFWILAVPSAALMCGFVGMAVKGIKSLMTMHRFKLYTGEIGSAEMCNISTLASSVGKSVDYVVKDIEKMIKKGWFRQGHLDKQKTCLIVTDKMYQQYLQLEQQREQQRKDEVQKAEEQGKAQQSMTEQSKANNCKDLPPEVQKIVEQGDAYVRKIHECNDAIPGEEISEKISRIENLVDKIFDRVEQNPESVSDIRKLMDYYLPTTVKLLEAYAEMDAQPVGGENIQTAKREIEATLDTLNVAFEKLLDSLFQDAAWDVSSDISVLNTMLAQEGLKDDGLKKS